MKKVSIIIPVFNQEKYLTKCIDSILRQSYDNFELLLIDDGSTDGSGLICEKYAESDERVRCIKKKNGGVSSSRNRGINEARGELIAFVDSDDYLEKDYLQYLVNEKEKKKVDAFFCGNIRETLSRNEKIESSSLKGEYSGDEFLGLLLRGEMITSVWGAVYDKGIIGNLRFNEELYCGEDLYFLYELSKRVKKVAINQGKHLYHYVCKAGSLDGGYVPRAKGNFETLDKIIKDIEDINNKKLAYERYQLDAIGIGMDCIKYSGDRRELDFYSKAIVAHAKEFNIYSVGSKSQRIITFLFSKKMYGALRFLSCAKARLRKINKA